MIGHETNGILGISDLMQEPVPRSRF